MTSIGHIQALRLLPGNGGDGLDSKEHYIDRIYEAGAIPELWPGVIEDLRIAGAHGTALMVFRRGKLKATGPQGSVLIAK